MEKHNAVYPYIRILYVGRKRGTVYMFKFHQVIGPWRICTRIASNCRIENDEDVSRNSRTTMKWIRWRRVPETLDSISLFSISALASSFGSISADQDGKPGKTKQFESSTSTYVYSVGYLYGHPVGCRRAFQTWKHVHSLLGYSLGTLPESDERDFHFGSISLPLRTPFLSTIPRSDLLLILTEDNYHYSKAGFSRVGRVSIDSTESQKPTVFNYSLEISLINLSLRNLNLNETQSAFYPRVVQDSSASCCWKKWGVRALRKFGDVRFVKLRKM